MQEDIRSILEKNYLNPSLQVKKVSRGLVPKKAQEFLERAEPEKKEMITFILENTRYVSFENFQKLLAANVTKFTERIGSTGYYLHLPEKIGSEHWVLFLAWPLLRQTQILGFLSDQSEVPEGSHILLLDDAVYSGNHLSASIQALLSANPKNLNFHLVVPFVSAQGFNLLQFFEVRTKIYGGPRIRVNIYSSCRLLNIKEMLKKELPGTQTLYTNRKNLLQNLGCEGYPCPVYFDHAVGNVFASFPQLYLEGNLMLNPPDREPIQFLHQLLRKKEGTE